MKSIFLLSITALFFSCGSAKKANADKGSINSNYYGTVHLSANGCPYYIEIQKTKNTNNDKINYQFKNIYPVNLEEKYRKDGLKIHFNYNISRAMTPAGCSVDAVVSVENVSVK